MNVKVSIIVPVYNSENSLKKSLNSLVNQSLKEIEIILINDCSTDNSLKILKYYQNKYKDIIKLINLKEKKGAGGARNAGINIAKGEYIGFMDSDDDILPTMYETLYKIAKSKDYSIADCSFYNEGTNENLKTTINKLNGTLNTRKRKELILHAGFLWSKIIKRDILTKNNIHFRENKLYEDIDFLRVVFLYANSIISTDLVLYNHRCFNNSTTKKKDLDTVIFEKMETALALSDTFKKLKAYNIYKEELTYVIYKIYMNVLDCAVTLDKKYLNENMFKKLRDMFFLACNNNYENNKYILKIDKVNRVLAESNNKDYKSILKFLNKEN